MIAYRKVSDAYTTYQLRLPEPSEPGAAVGQELLTLADGRTVVSLPDGATLPEQPAPIAASIETLATPLAPELEAELRRGSPHLQLIDERVVQRIREVYSVDEEIKMLRIAPSHETDAWNAHVEACRAWGRAERAKLGL